MEKIWTIRNILEWSLPFLKKHSVDSPRLTSEILLAHVLNCKRLELYLQMDQPLNKREKEIFRSFLLRRAKREPTEYILGFQEFYDLKIEVNPHVLIPRPETEQMMEDTVKFVKQSTLPSDGIFLDLCTGSGAIACVLASNFPEATVVATDISKDALKVAQKNALQNGLSRIQFVESDLFAQIPSSFSFDLIVSNPPYIEDSVMPHLQAEVRDYEPHLALDGGKKGFEIIERIAQQLPAFLAPKASFFMEFGYDQGKSVLQLFQNVPKMQSIEIKKDYSKQDRYLQMSF